jgi:hypothetical protein
MNNQDIVTYNDTQPDELKKICQLLMDEIISVLPDAKAKIFHANPAWFINENPIVGYDVAPSRVNLLFWSDQSFDEPQLVAKGKHKAAGISYNSISDVDVELLQGWLEKSKSIQWGYKNIRHNNGVLGKITS